MNRRMMTFVKLQMQYYIQSFELQLKIMGHPQLIEQLLLIPLLQKLGFENKNRILIIHVFNKDVRFGRYN